MEDNQATARGEGNEEQISIHTKLVDKARYIVNTWEVNTEGKLLQSLERKDKKCKTQITAEERSTLATLDAEFDRWVEARELAKKLVPKDDGLISRTRQAMEDFKRTKEGKLRAKLVTKRNATDK